MGFGIWGDEKGGVLNRVISWVERTHQPRHLWVGGSDAETRLGWGGSSARADGGTRGKNVRCGQAQ